MLRPGLNHLLRSVVAATLAVLMPLAIGFQPAAAADLAVQLPGDSSVATLIASEQALLELTNADRVANGLDPLEFDPDTLSIARERAESQLGTAALTHYDANGELVFVHLLENAQLPYALAGENLARATVAQAGVTTLIEQALMKSPLHRKNILERTFTRVSIGVATDTTGQITFAEVYRN